MNLAEKANLFLMLTTINLTIYSINAAVEIAELCNTIEKDFKMKNTHLNFDGGCYCDGNTELKSLCDDLKTGQGFTKLCEAVKRIFIPSAYRGIIQCSSDFLPNTYELFNKKDAMVASSSSEIMMTASSLSSSMETEIETTWMVRVVDASTSEYPTSIIDTMVRWWWSR